MASTSRYVDWKSLVLKYRDVGRDYDEDAADPFIVEAESEVDARLAPVYAVPFVNSASVPGIVRGLVLDLAYYKMNWQQERSDKLYSYIEDRIKDILSGKLQLVTSAGVLDSANQLNAWTDRNYRNTVDAGLVEDMRVSSSWVQATAIERTYD